ncbi:hypothetical protein [Amycolatopsis sp. NPDC004079]|uniref:hypothetical protein n=1 Tax=Amycolatopsis sp. NPDC004079 TaxID=3154549 RepID=UPI0033B0ECCF
MDAVESNPMRLLMNEEMAALVAGVDLDSYRDMRWVADVDRAGWAGDLRLITREGWVRLPAGALVLKWKVESVGEERDGWSLIDYERNANRTHIPGDGVDLLSEQALAVLSARGYAMAWNFLARIDRALCPGEVVGMVSVSRDMDGNAVGTVNFHENRESEPALGTDSVDRYQSEAVMALVPGTGFDGAWVDLPPLRDGTSPVQRLAAVEENEQRRLLDLARRAAVSLQRAGVPVAADAPAGDQGGAEVEVRSSDDPAPGVYVTWKASREWESWLDGLSGDLFHPDVERAWHVEAAMSRAIASILDAFGLVAVVGREGRPLEIEVRDPERNGVRHRENGGSHAAAETS